MKLLFWLSFIPQVPFMVIGTVAGAIAGCCWHIGAWIHDATTYQAWLVLHRRKCESYRQKGASK